MKVYVDLHIHSALSPCAENEMTPNNIVNMAWLKGLDIIAITDHNAMENCEAVLHCAKERGILAIPGMEVESREEVHVLCLFPRLAAAMEMQKTVWSSLPDRRNREDIFGEQLRMDDQDRVIGRIDRMLITAADMGIEEVVRCVQGLGGVAIPAHIDRPSYSILSNLGWIPEELGFRFVELSKDSGVEAVYLQKQGLEKYRWIRSSDAHRLEDIQEREFFLDIDRPDIPSLLEALKR